VNAAFDALRPWLLAVAWGALAAAPLAVRARRQHVDTRVRRLRPHRPESTRPRFAHARRLLARGSASTPGRIVLDVRARHRARRDDARLGTELPVTIDLLGVAVGAGCTPYLAVDIAARWAPPLMSVRLASVRDACGLGATFSTALDDLAARAPPVRPLADALLASDRLGARSAPRSPGSLRSSAPSCVDAPRPTLAVYRCACSSHSYSWSFPPSGCSR